MPAPIVSAQDCCQPCDSIPITQVPGPAGAAGAAGAAGTNGANAFSTTNAAFVQPAVGATVVVTVVSSAWAIIGEDAFVQNGGYYLITAITDATHVTLQNRGYTGNAAPTTVIGSGQRIGPSGVKGLDGVAVGVTLNSISPTTTRGDALLDNGSNSPSASVVRFAAGADGTIMASDAAQPAGRKQIALTPNAATDNVIPRFDGAAADTTPTVLQSSGIRITDNAALQQTAGNAKGTDAVDLQPARSAVTQVASGANAFLVGKNSTASGADSVAIGDTNVASAANSVAIGDTNTASGVGAVALGTGSTASGLKAVVGGGDGCTSSGSKSVVGGGQLCQATGDQSVCAGGDANVASGTTSGVLGGTGNAATNLNSAILGGRDNVAGADNSAIIGGRQGKTLLYGQVAHASGQFASAGDAQTSELIWRVTTTDATANVEAFLDGATATQRATVPNNTTWTFDILVVARRSNGDSICFRVVGGIKNDAGTTVLVAATTETVLADGTGGALTAANIDVDADNANDALRCRVTGIAAQTWRWVFRARLVEVGH